MSGIIQCDWIWKYLLSFSVQFGCMCLEIIVCNCINSINSAACPWICGWCSMWKWDEMQPPFTCGESGLWIGIDWVASNPHTCAAHCLGFSAALSFAAYRCYFCVGACLAGGQRGEMVCPNGKEETKGERGTTHISTTQKQPLLAFWVFPSYDFILQSIIILCFILLSYNVIFNAASVFYSEGIYVTIPYF